MKRAFASLVLVSASLVATPAAAAPLCAGREATIVGTPRREVLTGTPGDDVIVGGRGADTLIGLGGNDRLCGGRGRDFLFGGLDADILAGGRGSDLLLGGPGNDLLDGGRDADEVSYLFARSVRVDLDAGRARGEGQDLLRRLERVTGSVGPDRLFGGTRGERLAGDSGDDVLRGRGGNDLLEGGRGDDQIFGGAGTDGAIFDAARAGVEATMSSSTGEGVDALAGLENLRGTRFGDRLTGDAGPNVLSGNSGFDRLFGGLGDDRLSGDLDGAEADGGEGADVCRDTDPSPGCESLAATSRTPTAEISVPWPGALLAARDLDLFRGRELGAVRQVRLAIRLLTSNGCGWWFRGTVLPGGCASPRYVTPATDETAGTFTFRFRHRPPTGRYMVRVEVRTAGSDRFVFGDAVGFQLI